VTFSAGVVEVERNEDPAASIRRADGHLYEAKAAGRNRTSGAPATKDGKDPRDFLRQNRANTVR
jgi:hypothetical protein